MNVDELRAAFAELPELEPVTKWDHHRLNLRKNVEKLDPEKFLQWATIQATMFVGDAPYIRGEYNDVMSDCGIWWKTVTRDPGFGEPSFLPYAPQTSGNFIHQAYHLKQWLHETGKDILGINSLDCVCEIGGGYGAMAIIMRQAAFNGIYYLYDSWEFKLLQEFYYTSVREEEYKTLFGLFRVAWMPLTRIDLFIALFSLSEMPLEDRIIPDADSYLITYQPQWEGRDNHLYFSEWAESKSDFQWSNYHNPHFGNYRYLIGWRDEKADLCSGLSSEWDNVVD